MRISRIFYEDELHSNSLIDLPLDSSHYLIHVLRLKKGDQVTLFNGNGQEFTALLVETTKKTVRVQVGLGIYIDRESPLKIHLVQAISKGEKMDWTIQKAVELGVAKITPLITQHCAVKLNPDRLNKKLNHWKKIMISACEQSGRTKIPMLSSINTFVDWINGNHTELKLVCNPTASATISSLPATIQELLLFIGPEGGLSDQEISLTRQHDFIPISLGPRILRTETAAISALALIQNKWGDLSH